MNKGGMFKHVNNTEVAILVHTFDYMPQTHEFKLKVDWLNIVNPYNIFKCGVLEYLVIKADDIDNWEPYEQV